MPRGIVTMLRLLFALLLLALPNTAHADWYEASAPHFLVYADRDSDRLQAFATNLERFDRVIRIMVGQSDTEIAKASRVTVFMVDDVAAVQTLLANKDIAGFFVPRASGSFAVVPQKSTEGGALALKPLQVLLHEYSHYLMWSLSPDTPYPAWLIEGFAEFNATARFEKDGSVRLGEPPLYRGIGIMSGNNMSIDRLLGLTSKPIEPDEMDAFYGRAWLLTHYLRIGAPQRSTQLGAYVAALTAGKPPAEAARVFGDLKQLDGELEVYKKRRMPISIVPGDRLVIAPVALRKLSPGAAATMDVRIRSKVTANPKTAPGIFADAVRAAGPYPGDAEAQLTLAGTALDAGDYPAAGAASDRALAADPEAVRALTYKATAEMLAARKAKDASPQRWIAIRALLSSANRLDPRDPVPLLLYYRSYTDQGVAPPQIAKQGLKAAFLLAPYDPSLRVRTAIMYLRDRDAANARTLLCPARLCATCRRNWRHGGGSRREDRCR